MVLDEFNDLMVNFVDNDFPVREIPVIYCCSIPIQLDEVKSDRHLNMFFPEFLEAFCRVVDKASPAPESGWPKEKRESQHLADKLKNIVDLMISAVKGEQKGEISKFQRPEEDEEGLLVYDATQNIYLNVWPGKKIMSSFLIRKEDNLLRTN